MLHKLKLLINIVLKLNPIYQNKLSYINQGIKYSQNDYSVNERVIEKPVLFKQILKLNKNSEILDFGCSRSSLVIELASLGYKVTGIDLRDYPFVHPNFKFYKKNILDLDTNIKYDFIIALSVVEHIGLGAYGENTNTKDFNQVMDKLTSLVKPGGRVFISIPVGKSYFGKFLRSFTPKEGSELLKNYDFTLTYKEYFKRKDNKTWLPSSENQISTVSNAYEDRGPKAVNAVGCYLWQKN